MLLHNADLFIEYAPTFPYYESLQSLSLPKGIYSLGNFDGVHYLTIIESGYQAAELIQAFFPMYPLLVAGIAVILGTAVHPLVVGIGISVLCFMCALLVLRRLDMNVHTTAAYCVFPTAFFFAGLYTESLFLLLILVFFSKLKARQYWQAALVCGLATSVRFVGIFLVFSLLTAVAFPKNTLISVQLLQKRVQQRWKQLIGLSAVSLSGVTAYMLYLWVTFSDPLHFITVQKSFNTGRNALFVLLPQTLFRGFKTVVLSDLNLRWITSLQEFGISCMFLCILLLITYEWVRQRPHRMQLSWLVFSWGAYLLPTMTGTLASMPRYVLVCFPVFIWIGKQLKTASMPVKVLYYVVSVALLCINIVVFAQGRWVA